MHKKALLAKFEWQGLPEPLTDIFVENLIFNSSDRNFAVVRTVAGREFWSYYNVLKRESDYGIPQQIQVTRYLGGVITTNDFVLFNNFKTAVVSDKSIGNMYAQLISMCTKALRQHLTGSELIATVYARSQEEATELKNVLKGYDGVKVVKHDNRLLDNGKQVDFVQFEFQPRFAELEQLKHNLENDLFLRYGIDNGIDKTHITNANLKDSEQAIDLINSFELKLRQDFCARLNKWRESHGNGSHISVKIHSITTDNSIEHVQNSTDKVRDVE